MRIWREHGCVRSANGPLQVDVDQTSGRSLTLLHFHFPPTFVSKHLHTATMGALGDLWLRWKMLRLPWRKQFLVGTLDCCVNETVLLTSVRSRSLGQYFLGIQGCHQPQPVASHRQSRPPYTSFRYTNPPSVASMAPADSRRTTHPSRAGCRRPETSCVETQCPTRRREVGCKGTFRGAS